MNYSKNGMKPGTEGAATNGARTALSASPMPPQTNAQTRLSALREDLRQGAAGTRRSRQRLGRNPAGVSRRGHRRLAHQTAIACPASGLFFPADARPPPARGKIPAMM